MASQATARPWNPLTVATALGLLHLVVDAASLAILNNTVAGDSPDWNDTCRMFLLYDGLAFALQVPLGLLSDRFKIYRLLTVIGLAATAVAIFIASHQQLAAIIVGVGNALFHVGAGAIVLRNCGGRATTPGIYVAPGALGLFLGSRLGQAGLPHAIPLGLLVAACAVAVIAVSRIFPPRQPLPIDRAGGAKFGPLTLCVILLALSVTVRSLTGGMLRQWWVGQAPILAVTLVAAAVAGKILGGILADRLGWRLVSGLALLALTPLIVPAANNITLAAVAMILIQLTMAVTLTAVYVAMPSHPGTAFGLLSLMLLIGDPWIVGYVLNFTPPWWLLAPLVLASAVMIVAGLALLPKPAPNAPAKN